MIRGTTPTHIFNLPIQAKTIKTLRITYVQNDAIVLEKTEKDVKMSTNNIRLKLSQEDTLKFNASGHVHLQLKMLTYDGAVLANQPKVIPIDEIYNEEVLV